MTPSPVEDWWEGTRTRTLLVQRCSACGHHQHHPRSICVACGATSGLRLVPASGRATVWSFTTVHRPPAPEVGVPYTLALVRLEEGPVMLSRLTHDDARCDEAVRVAWEPLPDGRNLPVFARAT